MESTEATVITYEPRQRYKSSIFASPIIIYRNITSTWEMNVQLFRRDFLMSYKKSLLGMSWLFITPILGVISWIFMNKTGILSPGDVGIPYPVYVLISTTIFSLFQSFFSGASGTLTAGAGFINQVNYPHDSLLVKQTLQQTASFGINFGIAILFAIAFGVIPTAYTLALPILILPIFFFGASIGLACAVINVVAPDIVRGISFLTGLLMYATPIIYSQNIENPMLQIVMKWNPLTYLIGGPRDLVLFGYLHNPDRYAVAVVISFIMFVLAWRFFYLNEQKVIEKMI